MVIGEIEDYLLGEFRIVCNDEVIFEGNSMTGFDITFVDRKVKQIYSDVEYPPYNGSSDDYYAVTVIDVE